MKPLEKIILTDNDLALLGDSFDYPITDDCHEYHLAPVWHDAETTPPAKNGDYLTVRKTQAVQYFQDVLFFDTIHGWQSGIRVDGWMPLPEPPFSTNVESGKESEG